MKSLDVDNRGQFVEMHIPDFDRIEKLSGMRHDSTKYLFLRQSDVVAVYEPRSFSGSLDFGTLVVYSPAAKYHMGDINEDTGDEVFTMTVGKAMDIRLKNKIQEMR